MCSPSDGSPGQCTLIHTRKHSHTLGKFLQVTTRRDNQMCPQNKHHSMFCQKNRDLRRISTKQEKQRADSADTTANILTDLVLIGGSRTSSSFTRRSWTSNRLVSYMIANGAPSWSEPSPQSTRQIIPTVFSFPPSSVGLETSWTRPNRWQEL